MKQKAKPETPQPQPAPLGAQVMIGPQEMLSACSAGVQLLEDPELRVPRKLAGALDHLEVILQSVLSGQTVLAPAPQQQPNGDGKKEGRDAYPH